MLPITYYLLGCASFLFVRHPMFAILVPLPAIYWLKETPIMLWAAIMGVATAMQAFRSLKKRVWPSRLHAAILYVPIALIEGAELYYPDSVPIYMYGLLVVAFHPLCLSARMMFRLTPYVAGTTLLVTTILKDDVRMQFNVMIVQALFVLVISFFLEPGSRGAKKDKDTEVGPAFGKHIKK